MKTYSKESICEKCGCAETHKECNNRVVADLKNPTPECILSAVFSECGESKKMCMMRVVNEAALYQTMGKPFTEAQMNAQYNSCSVLPMDDDKI